jgi:uncharacterized membrane protein YGL010W
MFDCNELLGKYEAYHKNSLNVLTHFIGIPLIVLAIFIPMFWLNLTVLGFTVSFAEIFFLIVLLYYFKLSIALGIGMFISVGGILYISFILSSWDSSGMIATLSFVIGWVFQFVGHYFEGRQPAFLTSLIQLLIGPFYLVAKIYFGLGLLTEQKKIILEKSLKY